MIANHGILVVVLMVAAKAVSALPCDVLSTNDGNGLFTYTFQRGDAPYVWGLDTNRSINLTSYGVLEVHTPPTWTYSIIDRELLVLTPTRGTNFLDEPVTFSVRSCLTESTRYDSLAGRYPAGIIVGVVYALPERTEMLGGGYQSFSYVGPALPRLSIENSGGEIILRWPAAALGLSVETSDLKSNWTPLPNEPILSGSTWTLKVNAHDSAQFFRLVTPCSP